MRLGVAYLLLPSWWIAEGNRPRTRSPQFSESVLHLSHEPFAEAPHLSRQFLLLVDARTMCVPLFLRYPSVQG